jgi:hypothetical protein
LIDECIDERLRNSLPGHECQTVRYAGMAGLTNGQLLDSAETAHFDVFVTVDQGVEYQQNLKRRRLSIVVLRGKSNRLTACLASIESIQPGQIVYIGD